MIIITILILLIVVPIIFRTFWNFKKGKITVIQFLGWLTFWLLVAANAIIRPVPVVYITEKLGASRATDLILYLTMIMIFYIFFRISIHLKKIDESITIIVRNIAITEAQQKKNADTKQAGEG
jgi:hypothetical protein